MAEHHICYICQIPDDSEPVIRPCECRAETGWSHKGCLEDWIRSQVSVGKDIVNCPFCATRIPFTLTPKPFSQWKRKHWDCLDIFKLISYISFLVLGAWAALVVYPTSMVYTVLYQQYTYVKPFQLVYVGFFELTCIAIAFMSIRKLVVIYQSDKLLNQDIHIDESAWTTTQGRTVGGPEATEPRLVNSCLTRTIKSHLTPTTIYIGEIITSGVVSITITLLNIGYHGTFAGNLYLSLVDAAKQPTPPQPNQEISGDVSLRNSGAIFRRADFHEKACFAEIRPGDCLRMEVDIVSWPRKALFFNNGEIGASFISHLPPSVRLLVSVDTRGTAFRIDHITTLKQPTPHPFGLNAVLFERDPAPSLEESDR
ncbi:hypothetical protein BLNAU_18262 [Blattamonas nauphoetae]|uniref:RING-CH-type domain-containing protein n=1 Tax=Blattamonas nauphoetae TaxID=2049346 RepID=A0ABQ9X4W4_9EUKA|nr:hypothetical protein BLNAU_18262 [Blattamonas nauphoetae]